MGCTAFSSKAIDTPDIPNISEDERNTAGLHSCLNLCVGCRVMLLHNIKTSQCLVNGAQGKVVSFQWANGLTQNKPNEQPVNISVLFDDPKV